MRKLLIVSSVMLILSAVSVPKAFSQVELFAGYSHLTLNSAPSNIGSSSNGWESSLYLHVLGPLGAEADFSNNYGVSPALPSRGGTFYVPQFMALYGPRFTLALPRIHPFVHALFGTIHGIATVPLPAPLAGTTEIADNAFGLAFGGGINIKATRRIWLRLIQVDYVRSQFPNNGQNETRISAGLVYRFGQW